MKEFWNTIQLIFAGIGGWLGYFLGGCDGLLYALIAFVVIDYITGVMCAIANHTLSSEVGFKGICRKVLIFLLVASPISSTFMSSDLVACFVLQLSSSTFPTKASAYLKMQLTSDFRSQKKSKPY
jgi:toxin secretion/phage lysis holin